MSDQNPIHRDGGRRDQGGQPYTDDRETFAEKEAAIERSAARPDQGEAGLTEEEQRKLDEQAAERRLDEIGKDVTQSREAEEDSNGN